MKKLLLALAALMVAGLAIFYFLPDSSNTANANVVFQDESGKKLTEKDFTGKPTVYYAWASWCPDCQQELPILNTLKEKFLAGNFGYGHAKTELFDKFMDYFAPFQKKREELLQNMDYVNEILKKGALKAREIATKKVDEVRDAVGIMKKSY